MTSGVASSHCYSHSQGQPATALEVNYGAAAAAAAEAPVVASVAAASAETAHRQRWAAMKGQVLAFVSVAAEGVG